MCIFFFQVIAAEGEQKASRALKEASDIISESSSALQLRYLQVLSREIILGHLPPPAPPPPSFLVFNLFYYNKPNTLPQFWCGKKTRPSG
jgi:hypothetical protein